MDLLDRKERREHKAPRFISDEVKSNPFRVDKEPKARKVLKDHKDLKAYKVLISKADVFEILRFQVHKDSKAHRVSPVLETGRQRLWEPRPLETI